MKLDALLVLAILSIFLTGCVSTEIKELSKVEVKEYNGTKLSSIGGFRENSIKGPQYVNISGYHLEIYGLVNKSGYYSYDELLNDFQRYQKVVTLNCVEGWSEIILWEGILIKDILKKNVPLSNANTIIFHAYDGYSTSFPLSYVTDNDILMAYKMNDVILPPERGFPFQLVAEDKWGYKWVKWVTRIELSNDTDYRGFWEQRGYSNEGNLNRSFYSN